MQDLQGKVAVVTGAASGIGKAMATRFARDGARLVLADIEIEPLEATATELRASGAEVREMRTDVSQWDDVAALADAAYDAFGQVDVLCNNAGVVMRGPVWEISLSDWEWVIGVDLWSVVYGIRAFVPRMLASGRDGHVVNTASTAGLFAYAGIGPYNVAKVGVVALSETLHHDLRDAGAPIGVSVLCPGLVATRIGTSDRNRPGGRVEAGAEVFSGGAPRPAPMSADDVADRVRDAILADQFWIITHDAFQPLLEQRFDAVLHRRVPQRGVAL